MVKRRHDGLLFELVEVLERLAALTPPPRINLVLHHGVLAPNSRWRARAVVYGRDTLAPTGSETPVVSTRVSG
jgi:Putative transposase